MIVINRSNRVYNRKLGTLDEELEKIIEESDFDSLENCFMERLEKNPDDFPFFLSVLHRLVHSKEYEHAELFFQFIIDSQKEDVPDEDLRGFLMGILRFWDCEKARNMLSENIKKYYNTPDNFEQVLKLCGYPDSENPLNVLEKVESMLQYSEGNCVFMKEKGAGIICDVNLKLRVIRAVFNKSEKLSFKLDEASRMLRYLPEGHIFHDKLTKPEKLKQDALDDPGKILQRLFSDVEEEMSTSEIKKHLLDIVPPGSWNKWWKRAAGDPRLVISPGKKQQICRWRESEEGAEESLMDEFENSSLDKKLKIVQRERKRSADFVNVMVNSIEKSSKEIVETDPSKALEALLALEKISSSPPEALKKDIDGLLVRPDIRSIIKDISQKSLRKEALLKLKNRQNGWEEAFSVMLKEESDFSIISFIYNSLSEKARADMVNEIISYPSRAPRFYVWLCREMLKSTEMKKLADWKFLKGLCGCLKKDSMKKEHSELRSLFDPGKLADHAVKSLSQEEAAQFLSMLEKEIGVESFRRDDMAGYIRQQFPGLDRKKTEPLYVTQQSIEKKRGEYEKIVKVDIPHNTSEIKRAKEFGDLKENFEYHEARRRQELLSSQAKNLHDELVKTRAITPEIIDTSKIGIGTEVELSAESDSEDSKIRILGPWDSDPDNNIYSYKAPAVKSILGAVVGDSVDFNGRRYEVRKISSWE